MEAALPPKMKHTQRHRIRAHIVVPCALISAFVFAIVSSTVVLRSQSSGAPCAPSGVMIFVGTPPPPPADTTPPTVTVKAPLPGATVSGVVSLSACAADDVGVVGVQFKVDGANVGAEVVTAPWNGSWDTTAAASGSHVLTAVARDAAGHHTTSANVAVTVSNSGIAALYPGDVGIEANPNVIFVERFDESSLTSLFGRWTDILGGATMTLSADVPPGSPVPVSLNIPWVGGGVSSGGHLYKLLSPGVDDTMYLRYYIKYPTSGQYVHQGIWTGGYNPPLAWPNPRAGLKPAGNDSFSAAAEQDGTTLRMDLLRLLDGHAPLQRRQLFGGTCCSTTPTRSAKRANGCASNRWSSSIIPSARRTASMPSGSTARTDQPRRAGIPNGSVCREASSRRTPPALRFWRTAVAERREPEPRLHHLLADLRAERPGGLHGEHEIRARRRSQELRRLPRRRISGCHTTHGVHHRAHGRIDRHRSGDPLSDRVGQRRCRRRYSSKWMARTSDRKTPARLYSITWNSASVANGSHTVTAVARDAAGNTKTSAGVAIVVNNASVSAWPNEPAGFVTLTDQPWNATVGSGWNRRSGGTDVIFSDASAPMSPSNVLRYVYPIGLVDGVAPGDAVLPGEHQGNLHRPVVEAERPVAGRMVGNVNKVSSCRCGTQRLHGDVRSEGRAVRAAIPTCSGQSRARRG